MPLMYLTLTGRSLDRRWSRTRKVRALCHDAGNPSLVSLSVRKVCTTPLSWLRESTWCISVRVCRLSVASSAAARSGTASTSNQRTTVRIVTPTRSANHDGGMPNPWRVAFSSGPEMVVVSMSYILLIVCGCSETEHHNHTCLLGRWTNRQSFGGLLVACCLADESVN